MRAVRWPADGLGLSGGRWRGVNRARLAESAEERMAEEFVIEKFAFKMVLRGIGIVLLIAALLYPLDFAVWRVRVARGGGMGR